MSSENLAILLRVSDQEELQRQTIKLSVDVQRRFVEALLDPPSPNLAILEAFELYGRMVDT